MVKKLMIACLDNNIIKVKELIAEKGGINDKIDIGHKVVSPLSATVRYGYRKLAEYLITNGADINDPDVYPPILQTAVRKKNIEMIKMLLEHNASVDILDDQNSTPLHWAVFGGNLEIVEILLAHGANRSLKDDNDLSPIDLAKIRGWPHIIELLGG